MEIEMAARAERRNDRGQSERQASKTRFIAEVMKGDKGSRSLDDVQTNGGCRTGLLAVAVQAGAVAESRGPGAAV